MMKINSSFVVNVIYPLCAFAVFGVIALGAPYLYWLIDLSWLLPKNDAFIVTASLFSFLSFVVSTILFTVITKQVISNNITSHYSNWIWKLHFIKSLVYIVTWIYYDYIGIFSLGNLKYMFIYIGVWAYFPHFMYNEIRRPITGEKYSVSVPRFFLVVLPDVIIYLFPIFFSGGKLGSTDSMQVSMIGWVVLLVAPLFYWAYLTKVYPRMLSSVDNFTFKYSSNAFWTVSIPIALIGVFFGALFVIFI